MMKSSAKVLIVYAAVLLMVQQLAVPSNAQEYIQANGTYTTSLTSSCFKNDYSKWGSDRSLAVGVSPAVFKVGRNGSLNACGVTTEVKCLKGGCQAGNPTLKVTVVDECKNCDDRTIRLSLTAYNEIAFVDMDPIILGYRYL